MDKPLAVNIIFLIAIISLADQGLYPFRGILCDTIRDLKTRYTAMRCKQKGSR